MNNKLVKLKQALNGRVEIRNVRQTAEKQCSRTGLKPPSFSPSFPCAFCGQPGAEHQIATRFGRSGDKIQPVGWKWICRDCMAEIEKI